MKECDVGYDSNYAKETDIPKGWVCPKCGTVNAPWMPYCLNCSGFTTSSPTVKYTFICPCGRKFDDVARLLDHWKNEHLKEESDEKSSERLMSDEDGATKYEM